jgi:MFS transporter, DHA3 family, macrolide efflux protein
MTNKFPNKFLWFLVSDIFESPSLYIYTLAVQWLMLTMTDNRSMLSILLTATMLANLLLMVFGGVLADRFSKKKIILTSLIVRIVLITFVVTSIIMDFVSPWLLISVSFLFGVSNGLAGPAYSSFHVGMLDSSLLQKANGIMQLINQMSSYLGPFIGSLIIAFWSIEYVFFLCIGSLLIAFLCINFIKEVRNKEYEDSLNNRGILKDMLDGFRFVKQNEILSKIVSLAFVINFLFSGTLALAIPLLAKDVLGGGPNTLAILSVSLTIGISIGSLLMSFITNIGRYGKVAITSLLLMILTFSTLVGYGNNIYLICLGLVIIGFLLQFMNIPIFTLIQKTTHPKLLGRVMSIFVTGCSALTPLSLIILSFVIGKGIDIQTIITVTSVVALSITIYMAFFKGIWKIEMKEDSKIEEVV